MASYLKYVCLPRTHAEQQLNMVKNKGVMSLHQCGQRFTKKMNML